MPTPGAALRIGDLTLLYQEHAKGYYTCHGQPTGEAVTIDCALRPLNRRFSRMPVDKFGPSKLEQVQEDMIKLGRSQVLHQQELQHHPPVHPVGCQERAGAGWHPRRIETVDGLKKSRTCARETKPVGPAPDNQVDATLPHVSDQIADAVRVIKSSGMRPGETVAMRPAEIDRTDPTLWVYRPSRHKLSYRGSNRTVYLGPACISVLLPYIVKTAENDRLFPITRNACGGLSAAGACGPSRIRPFQPSNQRTGRKSRRPS